MVTSFTRGRIRLRLAELKGTPPPQVPTEGLKGLKNLTFNPMTGSVLIEYDPDVLDVETIASFLEPFDPQGAEALRNPEILKPKPFWSNWPKSSPKPQRPGHGSAQATAEVINLGIGLLTCVASGFFASPKTHARLGLLFGAMLVQHVFKYRKRLRPLKEMSLKEILGLDSFPFPMGNHNTIYQELEEDVEDGLEEFITAGDD
jgi:hypothetical protein